MARPFKQGLDYFPLDVECDDKVKMIDAKFGAVGFGILIKLWQIIYDNSYFTKWTEREVLLYKNRINADINLINDVINECVKWELFNPATYKTHGVLTSRGIQKRYLEAIKRRHKIVIYLDYWEIDIPENTDSLEVTIVQKEVNPNNNHVNDNNNPIDSYNSTQSKVKESKKKKKALVDCLLLGSQKNVKLTKQEYDDLKAKYPSDAEDIIEFLCLHIAEKGDKSTAQTHIFTIKKWVIDAVKEKKARGWKGFGISQPVHLKPDPIQEELEKPGTIFIDIDELMKEGGIDGLDGIGKQERKNW